jgi:hypothetical protein
MSEGNSIKAPRRRTLPQPEFDKLRQELTKSKTSTDRAGPLSAVVEKVSSMGDGGAVGWE